MNFSDYNPETICRWLGLPGFKHDPAITESDRALRLLFRPAFHAEACVTIHKSRSGATLSFVGFVGESLWHAKVSSKLEKCSETCALSEQEFEQVWRTASTVDTLCLDEVFAWTA